MGKGIRGNLAACKEFPVCREEECEDTWYRHYDVISEYWTGKFKQQKIGTLGFDKVLKDYLLWGFGLGQVCKYIVFKNEDAAHG